MTNPYIGKLFDEIADSTEPLVHSHLADLVQMTVDDLPAYRRLRDRLGDRRHQQFLSRLVELARDNVELNFDLISRESLNDADADVRGEAIEGLWENRDPVLIHQFIGMLENDPSESVQALAAEALGRFALMAELEEIRPAYKNTLSKALLTAVNDTTRGTAVRRRALEAMAPLSLPAVTEAIRKAYESRDERFIVSAIYAMGRTCDETWLPALYREMDNPDAERRYEAAGACGEIGSEDSVSYLRLHINDPDLEVRLAVVRALGQIGGEAAKTVLRRYARDSNRAVRETIKQVLAELERQDDMTLFEMTAPGSDDDSGQED